VKAQRSSPAEQQQQLAELAVQRGRDADALAQEAISRYLAEEAHFIEAVRLGEAALERGEYLTHEQVGRAARAAVSVRICPA
jgi:predicted transcriptional regulator